MREAVPFDIETGLFGDYFFRYKQFSTNGKIHLETHPDSNISLQGQKLPMYEQVRHLTYAICNYLSSLEYFGLDFIVTENSVKLLEINSLPAITGPQILFGPIFENPNAADYFTKKISEKHIK